MRRMSVLHQNSGGIGKSIPSALEISLGLRPREISWVSGNLLGMGDGFPNTSLVLVEHGYNQTLLLELLEYMTKHIVLQMQAGPHALTQADNGADAEKSYKFKGCNVSEVTMCLKSFKN